MQNRHEPDAAASAESDQPEYVAPAVTALGSLTTLTQGGQGAAIDGFDADQGSMPL
ncbi:MAG: lasso RiPP family leader peptide-containing protein [Solirubrobacteraceae bacterium]|nr:lasso RiPP family leader peptide-containing protein [Solirubrobacteraceae bacterium]